MNNQDRFKICQLAIKKIEGVLTPQEDALLCKELETNQEALNIYVDLAIVHASLSKSGKVSYGAGKTSEVARDQLDELFTELSKEESDAESVTIKPAAAKPQREIFQNTDCHNLSFRKKFSKWNIGSLIATTAAAVFLVLFTIFAPPKGRVEVVTLTDSIHAKWADAGSSMQTGSRLCIERTPLLLREGFAELLFDTNARIVIEAPCEFQILAEDRINLNYGKVYAIVPKEATGFSVYTQNAKIIDLGTEFGVQSDAHGDTSLHVIKGKTTLIAGDKSNNVSMEVGNGLAKKISSSTSVISDIPCNETLFVRAFDSVHNVVWRQKPAIDLADIVGGGNGFGTGKKFSALTLSDNLISSDTPVESMTYKQSVHAAIHSNPFVDSLFVPKGKTQVSSQGEMVAEFPDTTGLTFGCVTNGGIVAGSGDGWNNTVLLGGKEYGMPGAEMIHIHSNLGVTFDLNQIRQSIPSLKIVGFSSLCGITETAQQMPGYNSAVHSWVDFWVLVDGVVQFKKEHVSLTSGPIPIDIKLKENDRYLSLAVTDCDGSILFDWSIFAMPRLTIISSEN